MSTEQERKLKSDMKNGVMNMIYNKINSVIGAGDQLFTMTFPAQPLNYRRFVYDTSNRNSVLTKPYTIAEAEFRLSDQMFNPVPITAGSNGKKLSSIYHTLINNYVPSINELAPFFRDRAGLSRFLLQPSGEIDEDGNPISRMGLTNMLYEKYLVAKNEWNEKKNKKFDELKSKNLLDDYSRWLSSAGLVEQERLNNMYNDVVVRGHLHEVMTLLGYINSSSTAEELEMVKQRMRHSVRTSLDESMLIYPVQFQPSNWFMAMTPNLQPQDLTMAKDVLSDQLRQKRKQLHKTKSKLAEIELLSVSNSTIGSIHTELAEGRDRLQEAENKLMQKYGDGVVTAVKTYLNYKAISAEMSLENYINSYTGGAGGVIKNKMLQMGILPEEFNTSKDIEDTVKGVVDAVVGTYKANGDVMAKQRELLELQTKLANAKAHEMSSEKIRLRERVEDLEADVKYLSDLVAGTHGEVAKHERQVASLEENEFKGWSKKTVGEKRDVIKKVMTLFPNLNFDVFTKVGNVETHFDINKDADVSKVTVTGMKNALGDVPKNYALIPKNSEAAEIDGMFTDVTIKIEQNTFREAVKNKSEATDVHANLSIGFVSASASYSHSKSSNSMESEFLSNDMEIGFRVAKVSFDRGGWFNPALFDMSKSFYHLAKLKAGAGFTKNKEEYAAAERTMNSKEYDYMLPSFPVAMVIAKDITIKVVNTQDVKSFSKTVESESMSGNAGLFCFSVSGGKSSDSMAESSFHGHDNSSFYIRIPGPQILGYYQQFVKLDESKDYVSMISDDKRKAEAPLMKALHEFELASQEMSKMTALKKNLKEAKEDAEE